MAISLPEWILRRDGQRVPFEPEVICQDLFLASESLGESNSFLARELTEGVLFFMGSECNGEPTTQEMSELVVKVVRELGHPQLAERFLELRTRPEKLPRKEVSSSSPAPSRFREAVGQKISHFDLQRLSAREALRQFSEGSVYPRDLLSAASEGLLHLTDLENPLELSGWIFCPTREKTLLEMVLDAREVAGQFLAVENLEELTEKCPSSILVREFLLGLKLSQFHAYVNLNRHIQTPLERRESGLFQEEELSWLEQVSESRSREMLQPLLNQPGITVYYHLRPTPEEPGKERDLAECLLKSRNIEVVFDRRRRQALLAPGIDLRHSALLSCVGIHLGKLAEQLGGGEDIDLFLKKLGSLARFAKSVGHIRRKALRKYARPETLSGFLLERARLLIYPIDLEPTARKILGVGATSPSRTIEFQVKLLKTIQEALAEDRPGLLETVLDVPPEMICPSEPMSSEPLTVQQQIRFGSQLQQAMGGGLLTLTPEAGEEWTVESILNALERCRQSEVLRVRFDN